jgi:beta-lactamase class C
MGRMLGMIATIIILLGSYGSLHAQTGIDIQQVVTQNIAAMLPPDDAGGVTVAIRANGKTRFFNYDTADAFKKTLVTEDSLFNLASVGKVFATTILAQAVKQGELKLEDPAARYVSELAQGGDINRVTLGQLASHTSGLPRVPQDEEQWHRGKYTLPDFIRFLKSWRADNEHEPGKQYRYSNAGIILLRLAIERRFNTPFPKLLKQRLVSPLGMSSTALLLSPALLSRTVQGYGANGSPLAIPGAVQGTFDWPGAGQIYSSSRDMAVFLAANLGELSEHCPLQEAMAFAHEGLFSVTPRFTQALAWEIITREDITIIDKNGGLKNTSTYVGFVPQKKIGVVILSNRGREPATRVGREILYELAVSSRSSNSLPAGKSAQCR